jgi:hypothetical protein
MADKALTDPTAPVPSAEQLRAQQLDAQMKKLEQQDRSREEARKAQAAFNDDFLENHIGEEERAMIRRLVRTAAENGQMEVLVYSFPSDLCTDRGRAIRNSEPHWPDTLQGKAKEMYELFMARAQPQGYKLKAMIINFPGGIPGDVGFFLNWAPPIKV